MNTLSCIYFLGLGFTGYIGIILSNIGVMLGFWLLGVLGLVRAEGLGAQSQIPGTSPILYRSKSSTAGISLQSSVAGLNPDR